MKKITRTGNGKKCLVLKGDCVTGIWHYSQSRAVFLNRRAAVRYRALASIITGLERFSWNLSF